MKDTKKLKEDIVYTVDQKGTMYTFHSTWGLFSPTMMDDGTKLFLDFFKSERKVESIFDLGCGYGALGIPLAKNLGAQTLTMVDKDFVAVKYAKDNAKSNGVSAEVFLSNAFSEVPEDSKYDLIVSNIPAKVGKELLWIILEDVKRHLLPGGELWIVTINGLREFMKRNMGETFGNYEKVKQGKAYTIAKCVKS